MKHYYDKTGSEIPKYVLEMQSGNMKYPKVLEQLGYNNRRMAENAAIHYRKIYKGRGYRIKVIEVDRKSFSI